jgi:hypothetical protein
MIYWMTYLLLLIVIGGAIWQYFVYKQLRQNNIELKNKVDKISCDLAGICSAAVNVDTRLTTNGDLLRGLLEESVAPKQEESETSVQPYQEIIEMVQKGAETSELVHQFGVSFDEADLLIRLHGAEKIK